jgi:hypothetical protein
VTPRRSEGPAPGQKPAARFFVVSAEGEPDFAAFGERFYFGRAGEDLGDFCNRVARDFSVFGLAHLVVMWASDKSPRAAA